MEWLKTLADLKPGDCGTVEGFSEDSPYSTRLQELGLLPGTRVHFLRRSPLGDPIEITFLNFKLSIRTEEARCVQLTAH